MSNNNIVAQKYKVSEKAIVDNLLNRRDIIEKVVDNLINEHRKAAKIDIRVRPVIKFLYQYALTGKQKQSVRQGLEALILSYSGLAEVDHPIVKEIINRVKEENKQPILIPYAILPGNGENNKELEKGHDILNDMRKLSKNIESIKEIVYNWFRHRTIPLAAYNRITGPIKEIEAILSKYLETK